MILRFSQCRKEAAEKIDNTVYDDEAAQWAKLHENIPMLIF